MQISLKPYLLNLRLSGFPQLRIYVHAEVDWTTAIVGTHTVDSTFQLKQVNAQLVDIVLNRRSALLPLDALIADLISENFVSILETLLQGTTKNDGTKLDGSTEPTTNDDPHSVYSEDGTLMYRFSDLD